MTIDIAFSMTAASGGDGAYLRYSQKAVNPDYAIFAERWTALTIDVLIMFQSESEEQVSLRYRICAFGKPRGPWRTSQRQAKQDAIAASLGGHDEWGQFFLDGVAQIEWIRDEDLRLRA